FRSWVVDNSVAGDVHVRGYYPGFAARFFEENEMNLETMPEDDEIIKNGTVDFVSSSYYSSNCAGATQKGKITAANGGENIKNTYLETSEWGWQIYVLMI
ncbi:family 1 glycosylhydrolase, partial [Anaerobutyricum soehngenii]|uniref:family 1 glycosylhydrolase n=1 Tax=Anaerobutyricum soehngenii TaxID=105843 RepID=UPI001ADD8B97